MGAFKLDKLPKPQPYGASGNPQWVDALHSQDPGPFNELCEDADRIDVAVEVLVPVDKVVRQHDGQLLYFF